MKPVRSLSLPLSACDRVELSAGEQILLSGPCFTVRDASLNRLADAYANIAQEASMQAPEEVANIMDMLKDQLIFFAGPTPPHPGVSELPFGSIGPTTASRMDVSQIKLMPYGLTLSMGKGRRSDAYKQAARKHAAVYFAAVGGAAAVLAQHVITSEVVAWPELGTEAVMKLALDKFPAFVATDSAGADIYERRLMKEKSNGR